MLQYCKMVWYSWCGDPGHIGHRISDSFLQSAYTRVSSVLRCMLFCMWGVGRWVLLWVCNLQDDSMLNNVCILDLLFMYIVNSYLLENLLSWNDYIICYWFFCFCFCFCFVLCFVLF